MPGLSWLGLTLWACALQGDGDDAGRDARAYVAAVGAADPGACDGIGRGDLAAECRAFAAAEQAMAGDLAAAEATCDGLDAGPWRDECFFELADTIAAQGEEGRRLCDRAGGWAQRCASHAFGRRAQERVADLPVGEESEALADLEALGTAWFGPRLGPIEAQGFLASALAERIGQGPLSAARCGTASVELCAAAYRSAVLRPGGPQGVPTDGALLGTACRGPREPERIAAMGLPSWEPEVDEAAQRAWARLCDGAPPTPGGRPQLR
ncbi:MAG: hypothetical protein H6742_06745 [Alphaproteobacteria bacterium]|nr:hypothetical protein [Alphaproteobacteria bacterium]